MAGLAFSLRTTASVCQKHDVSYSRIVLFPLGQFIILLYENIIEKL